MARIDIGPRTFSQLGTATLTDADTSLPFLQAGMEGTAVHAYSGEEPTTYTFLPVPEEGPAEGGA